MPTGQLFNQRNDPAKTGFAKPFISTLDESTDGSGDLQEPSTKRCLVIEKKDCRIYTKRKLEGKACLLSINNSDEAKITVCFVFL